MIEFSIYQKPSDVTFLNFKSHNIASKIAGFDSLVRRAMILKDIEYERKLLK